MVISCKLCTNNSQSKCQNIKVSYKSASQVQWMQNIYITEWFKVWMMPQWLPAWAESNGILWRNKKSTRALSRRAREFCHYGISPRQTEIAFSLHDPKSKWVYSPHWKKNKKQNICRDNKKKKKRKIPVISRLQRAVNINNRNVQVESVGWRFPPCSESHMGASVHEPTRGTSLFQICVTAFAYISILSCFSVLCVVFFLLFFFFPFSSEPQRRRCRLVAPLFSAGPLVAMFTTDIQTRSQPMLVNQAFLSHNDWPCQDTEWHTAQ